MHKLFAEWVKRQSEPFALKIINETKSCLDLKIKFYSKNYTIKNKFFNKSISKINNKK